MDDTPNLRLPYIMAAQAQKHVTHNEAIRALDALVHLAVADRDLTVPPASPTDGVRYIVAAGATSDWVGQDGVIAAWQDGAWAFLAPVEGWIVWVADEARPLVYRSGTWQYLPVDPSAVNPVSMVGVNATADTTNRLAISAPASLFDHAGAGHQQKINKATAADTASQLYQTGFSGRAEIGLAGDDNFHFKVSADGATWREAMTIDGTTGAAAFLPGARHTFAHDATSAGLKITPVAGDPSAPQDGDLWYNATTGKLRKHEGGVASDVGSGGGVAGLTIASGKSLTVDNTLTLAGTDGTTMTFPSSSAAIARTDAAQTFTGNQSFSGLVTLANAQSLQFRDSSGTARNIVTVDSGNALIWGNAALPGNAFFYPGSGQNLRFLNAATTRYFMELRDSDVSISFGSNTHDTWLTFYNSLATTGDTAISIRAGAAREARLRFGSSGGTYDVGLSRDAAGILAVNDASTTLTNYRDLKLRNLYSGANQVVGARKAGWSTASGTATRSAFDTSTVTLSQLAERVKALIDDLHATTGHGLIGS